MGLEFLALWKAQGRTQTCEESTWRFRGSDKWGFTSLTWVVSILTLLKTLSITTHEPPSRVESETNANYPLQILNPEPGHPNLSTTNAEFCRVVQRGQEILETMNLR